MNDIHVHVYRRPLFECKSLKIANCEFLTILQYLWTKKTRAIIKYSFPLKSHKHNQLAQKVAYNMYMCMYIHACIVQVNEQYVQSTLKQLKCYIVHI